MKKLLALLCAAVMLCAPLAACANGSENSDDDGGGEITVPEPDDGGPQTPVTPQKPLVYNKELEKEMLGLYAGQFGATDGILHSFGIFGDYTAVVEFDSYVADAMTVVPVAGRQFVLPESVDLCAYNGGKLYGLDAAFEGGMLTDSDIAEIFGEFNKLNYGCKEGFDPAIVDAIKADYAKRYNTTADNVYVDIRGVYDGAYALWVHSMDGGYADAAHHEVVANVLFNYSSSLPLKVYHGGNFYSLSRAYKQGLLSRNDIIDLRGHYSPSPVYNQLGIADLTTEVAEVVCEYENANGYDTTVDEISIEVYAIISDSDQEVFGPAPSYVMFINGPWAYDCAVHNMNIGGVTFHYSDGQQLEYYFNGKVCLLDEAFKNGYLNVEELAMINYYFKNDIMAVV